MPQDTDGFGSYVAGLISGAGPGGGTTQATSLYGSGVDGAVHITSGTTYSRELECTTFMLDYNATLDSPPNFPVPLEINATESITFGNLTYVNAYGEDGTPADGPSRGPGGAGGPGGQHGYAGGDGAATGSPNGADPDPGDPVANMAQLYYPGSAHSIGGTGGGEGGAFGTLDSGASVLYPPWAYVISRTTPASEQNLFYWSLGGGGGGAGQNDNTHLSGGGGGGGGGGGVLILRAPLISLRGTTFRVYGGHGAVGGNGSGASCGGGGGGGGNGGMIILVCETLQLWEENSFQWDGGGAGAGGTGGSAGGSGQSGYAGSIWRYTPSTNTWETLD